MSEQIYAYATGFVTKLAEYGVSPYQFVEAAAYSGQPELVKIAEYLLIGAEWEKEAGIVSQGVRRGVDGKRALRLGYEAAETVAKGPLKARPKGLSTGAKAAIGGGAAATVAGTAYGMGDADTPSNKMKNMANENMGTNLKTQSRFSNMLS
jgi:hypothetical protein